MLYFKPIYRTQFFVLVFCLLLGISACKKSSNNVTGPDPGTDPDPTEEPDTTLPEITSIDPESGIIGIEVIITGKNFSATASENTVTFAGVEATISSASEDELVAEVPEGASSGPVEVTVNGNKATGPDFTVMSPEELPEITSVDPLSGTIGTEVTITGINFSANASENTVTFGGTEADVTSASETELIAEVPEGANSGPVEVTVNGITATGPDFEVLISNLVDAIDTDSELNMLSELIQNSDLQSVLEGEGPFTILAPTDDALNSLDPSFLSSLTPDEIEDILSYHVIAGNLEPDDFTVFYGAAIATIQGESVHTTTEGPRVIINNGATLGTSKDAPNGTIYKIDKLLLPDIYLDVFEVTYKRYVTNKFACSCVSGRTGIQDELQNENIQFTIFAPSNTAFFNRSVSVDSLSDAELRVLMNYHIVENQSLTASDLTNGQTLTTRNGQDITIGIDGGTITINGSAIIETMDLVGTNGVVHVIDTVLEPPSD